MNNFFSKFGIPLGISLIIFVLLFILINNRSDQDIPPYQDIAKLDSLMQLCNNSTESTELLKHTEALRDEALKQGNDLYMGNYYLRLLGYYDLFGFPMDSINAAGEKAIEYYRKANDRDKEITIEAALINALSRRWHSETALYKALTLLNETQESNYKYGEFITRRVLGRIYMYTGKSKEALEMFQQALQLKRDNNLKYELDMCTLYNEIGECAYHAEKQSIAFTYADSIRIHIKTHPNSKNNSIFSLQANLISLGSYLLLGETLDAKRMLADIHKNNPNIKEDISPDLYYHLMGCQSHYYKITGEFDKALIYADSLEAYYRNGKSLYRMTGLKKLRAEILEARGDYKAAGKLMQEIIIFTDSISKSNTDKQLYQLKGTYETQILNSEIEKHKLESQYTRTVIISLISVCTLLIIILAVIKYNAIITKEKNKKIFHQLQQLDKSTDEIEQLNTLVHNSVPEATKELSLYEKTAIHLHERQSFTNPDLTRESLALEVGTNRQYLTQAIQEAKSMTFTEYINDFRLEYARHLLCSDMASSVDSIYKQAGFSNKSTFYRLFKQKYNLTPKEIREVAKNELFK